MFDGFDDVEETKDYDYKKGSAEHEIEEKTFKRLYLVTQSTVDTLDDIKTVDSVDVYSDIVRAAIHMFKNTTPEKRKEAYEATKVSKAKTGRPVGSTKKNK